MLSLTGHLAWRCHSCHHASAFAHRGAREVCPCGHKRCRECKNVQVRKSAPKPPKKEKVKKEKKKSREGEGEGGRMPNSTNTASENRVNGEDGQGRAGGGEQTSGARRVPERR